MVKHVKKRRLRPDHPDALVRRGPRTIAGRRRVAQNARRHGLSVPPLGNDGFTAEAEALAHRICGRSEASEAGGAAASDAPDPEAPDRRNPSAAGGSDFGKTISGDKSHGIKAG
jgi:hypothetical protein